MVFFMKQTGDSFIYEYVNPACKRVFQKDLTGSTVDESVPPELAEEIKTRYRLSMERDLPYTYRDYNLFSVDRLATETEITVLPHEKDTYFMVISKNVAEQKKIEEDYSFYQSLVRNSVDPMIMITVNLNIFDMNPAYESAFDVQKEEWLGKNYADLPVMKKRLFKEVTTKLQKIIDGHPSTTTIIERKKGDGQLARFSANYSPIKENGEIRAFHIVLRELTNEAVLKQELKKTENILESYKDALNYAALVAIWDAGGIIQFVNNNFKGTTGYESAELIGLDISSIKEKVVSIQQFEMINEKISDGSIWRGEIKSLKKTGETFWVDATVIPLIDTEGMITQILSIMFDITDRKLLEEQLRFMAYHDRLTELPNRQLFNQEYNRMKMADDENSKWIAILYLDGDNFKQINDQYGHDAGDIFIRNFGQTIQKSLRHQDVAARVGGDEFLVALSGLDPAQINGQIDNIISRIKENLAKGWEIGPHKFSPTASIGVAIYPCHGDNLDELVKKADSSLYEAKKLGKNKVYFTEA